MLVLSILQMQDLVKCTRNPGQDPTFVSNSQSSFFFQNEVIFVQLVEKSFMHEQDSTRKHFSRMRAARLPTVRVSVRRCQHQWGWVVILSPMSGVGE